MAFLTYLLMVIEILVCVLLVGVVLLQKTRSHGGGLAFGAGMGEQLFGAQAGNVLTRATVILAVIFLANTLLLSIIGGRRGYRSVVGTAKAPAVQRPMAPVTRPEVPGAATRPVAPAQDAPVLPASAMPPSSVPVSVPESPATPAPAGSPAPAPSPTPAANPTPAPSPAAAPSGATAPAGTPSSG